jgi:N-methylhydantoinase A
MGYTIDIDTGGTFTDGFIVRGERVKMVKVPTTPHDLTVCFLDCVKAGADRFGIPIEDLLYETEIIRFSNTIGTNTIIQRDGSKVGLLVTAGRESLAPTRTDNGMPPLVLPDMVMGLNEEVSKNGRSMKAPDEQVALSAAQKLIDQGARCLVVAFANSEFNPTHERLIRKLIKAEYPRDYLGSVPVFLSSDISRRSGEAERINAAALNAFIHGKLVRLLYKAEEELRRYLYNKNLFIVHNNGAVARVAKTRAINTYNSGPAAGLLGAQFVGGLYKANNVISIDMGGTSFDVGFVRDGQASYTLKPDVEGLPVNLPMLAIRAIGAGGGSIASVKDRTLQVGPQSAGALPGPVCFDLGGAEPTVTDADLILGVLDPYYFLGGAMKLESDKTRQCIEQKIAKPLGVAVEAAALSIRRAVEETMGKQVGKVVKELGEGSNPLMVVYGGAGPAHCCGVAEVAGIKKILITPFSAVFSAFSSSNMDVGHLYTRRVDLPLTTGSDLKGLSPFLDEMRKEAHRDMRGEGFSSNQMVETLDLFIRGADERSEIKLSTKADSLQDARQVKSFIAKAQEALSALEGKTSPQLILTTVGLMVQAPVPHYQLRETPKAAYPVDQAKKGNRPVFAEDSAEAKQIPVYEWAKLQKGHRIAGPALVESKHTTALVKPGWTLK